MSAFYFQNRTAVPFFFVSFFFFFFLFFFFFFFFFILFFFFFFFFSSRRRHTRLVSDWSSDVCSSDLQGVGRRKSTRTHRRRSRRDRTPRHRPLQRLCRPHPRSSARSVEEPGGWSLSVSATADPRKREAEMLTSEGPHADMLKCWLMLISRRGTMLDAQREL